MKQRNLTCIVCPRGCQTVVTFDEDGRVRLVEGNACPRGKVYAEAECTHPVRTVTSTVRCEDESVISVKTSAPIPKELMFEVMKEINAKVVPCGAKIGDVVIPNVCGTGSDVLATSNWGQE